MTPEKLSGLITSHCPWASVRLTESGLTIEHDDTAQVTAIDAATLSGLLGKHNAAFGTWDKEGGTFSLRVTLARDEPANEDDGN